MEIFDAMCNLVPFVQFRKREKHQWKSVNSSIVAGWGVLTLLKLQPKTCKFTKINIPRWAFFTFFKLYKWYQIAQHIAYFIFKVDLTQILLSRFPVNIFIHFTNLEVSGCFQQYFHLIACPDQMSIISFNFPVDKGRRLNVHKTFRRCHGRLLNVLCTFNLHSLCAVFLLRRHVLRLHSLISYYCLFSLFC